MEILKIKIIDPIGLHARPASLVVQEANKWDSEIKINASNNRTANLKSIMSVMALGVKTGEEITIEASGKDEKKVILAIKDVMETNALI